MHAADVNLSDGAHKGRTAKGRQAERGPVRVESTDAATAEADRGNGRVGLWDEVEAALRVQNGQGLDGEDPELLLLAAERRAAVFEALDDATCTRCRATYAACACYAGTASCPSTST